MGRPELESSQVVDRREKEWPEWAESSNQVRFLIAMVYELA